ncbi:alpha/beta hydrolase [Streptomyces sp. NPDC000349]|uniref:alpha/beta hydrolase family protein n=1 Tax=unclassified Streptomyces TaxID=2593676 RepID=UPI00277E48D8|nr:alpha/beta hydrolase [Streptomyces sp. DSM 40167]MDQ0405517.1 putative dienelactone hydrolase [Streptomyces sp. DSM 40167]
MNIIRRTTAVTLLGLSLTLALQGPGAAATPAQTSAFSAWNRAESEISLPRPAGRYPVGQQTLHLSDHRRRDPWVPSAHRELMVSMHYPARAGRSAPAAYMTEEEARLLLEARGLAGVVPAATVSGVRTHARVDARPAYGRFPLVLLSPGFSMPRSTLTALANDLASRGYVVAAVDHAHESVGTSFPGGRVLTCLACEQVATDEDRAQVVVNRARDLSFVLDRLSTLRAPSGTFHGQQSLPYARMVDMRRIGAAGHSIGGAAAAAVMLRDERVRAGVNLDGNFFVPSAGAGLDGRPFMMMGASATHSPGSPESDWRDAWTRLDGWKRWLTVAGAEHFAFTDLPVLAHRLGLSDPAAPLPGDRSWQLTRDYTAAFLDTHLRGLARPLLDGPSADRPEVTFPRV